MKAKELAKLLLEHPEMDVFNEEYHVPEYSDGYNSVNSLNGITITPGGVFLNFNYLPGDTDYLKPPSLKPEIDTFRIKLKDTEHPYFCIRDEDDGKYFFEHFLNENAYYSYVCSNTWILYDENAELDDYTTNKLDELWVEKFTLEDVDYVEVLSSFDDQWVSTYDKMSFSEAMQYYINKYNIKKGENGY